MTKFNLNRKPTLREVCTLLLALHKDEATIQFIANLQRNLTSMLQTCQSKCYTPNLTLRSLRKLRILLLKGFLKKTFSIFSLR